MSNLLQFFSSFRRNKTFRGEMNEFVEKKSQLHGIQRVEVVGKKVGNGVNEFHPLPKEAELKSFLNAIDEKKIKELSLETCTLDPASGEIIGNFLQTNKSLRSLVVMTNPLKEKGMLGIWNGLMHNRSLTSFKAVSYNVARYHWSPSELNSLARVVLLNPALRKIELPDNQLNDFTDITVLLAPYQNIHNRKLVRISGFEVCSSVEVPDFCKENLDELYTLSQNRFRNRP